VVKRYVQGARSTSTGYDRLSDREREVLKLLAGGMALKEIAERLNLSVKTVDAHKTNLMRKLDLHASNELIKYAIQRKLIRLPSVAVKNGPSATGRSLGDRPKTVRS
jgi:DNA-binding NarL/FixJ family response regulator